MREVDYQDTEGRWWRVWLPDDAPDSEAPIGIPVGPPPLTSLNLPLALEVRLHNELFARGILTSEDARRSLNGIAQAWRAAVKVDTMEIANLYR